MALKKKMVRKWITALRSGEYQKCQDQLRKGGSSNGPSFCCLGVAFDSVIVPLGGEWRSTVAYINGFYETGVLPKPALEMLGLSNRRQRILFTMNDEQGKTFAEIADQLEEWIS